MSSGTTSDVLVVLQLEVACDVCLDSDESTFHVKVTLNTVFFERKINPLLQTDIIADSEQNVDTEMW